MGLRMADRTVRLAGVHDRRIICPACRLAPIAAASGFEALPVEEGLAYEQRLAPLRSDR
jgi:hypothetical protein